MRMTTGIIPPSEEKIVSTKRDWKLVGMPFPLENEWLSSFPPPQPKGRLV